MAMNSTKSNNFSATLFPLSGSNAVSKSEALAVKGMSQLGLNQRVESLRKFSLATKRRAVMFHGNAGEKVKGKEVLRGQFSGVSPISLGDGGDTERILRASEIVRVKLEHAVCNATTEENNKKEKEMVQAKLLSASPFASESDAVGGTSSTQLAIIAPLQRGSFLNHFAYPFPNIGRSSHFSPSQTDSEVDKSMTLCATPLSVCFPHESNYGRQKTRNSNVGGEAVEDVCCREEESEYDGRMHSNPHKKNGPYTCPKCGCVFETSQRFAAHVSSRHYKYETKSERKKRMMAKIRRRSLRLEWENGALTVVADDAPRATAFGFAGNNTNVAPPPPPPPPPAEIKIETETGVGLQLAPPPGWPKRTGARPESAGGFRIKMEPLDN
ncbi:hypothetical protein VNO80_17328 [Phaseolus coccineus]|uniref:C2H2-type domain-containing protein n=1 Tax=Phaseolus coccineus TaxID=3886 RepID=A0AAN9MSZ9_PHACN